MEMTRRGTSRKTRATASVGLSVAFYWGGTHVNERPTRHDLLIYTEQLRNHRIFAVMGRV